MRCPGDDPLPPVAGQEGDVPGGDQTRLRHLQSIWNGTASESENASAAEQVLAYEAEHHGELGLYRILFAGLNEFDDPEIREALRATYRSFHRWIEERIVEHRAKAQSTESHPVEAGDAAWAAVALGTIINVGRDLDLLGPADRARLLDRVGRLLLDPNPSTKRSD